MEEEAWGRPHVLVFQSLKRIAHSPLLNPANSRFLSALNAYTAGNRDTLVANMKINDIRSVFEGLTLSNSM